MPEPDATPDGTPDGEGRPGLPDRVTMPLLSLITQQALDEDYQRAARRRAQDAAGPAAGPRGPASVRRYVTATVVAVFGIVVATAAVQTTQNADINDASRSTLIERVDAGRDRVAGQEAQVDDMRERYAAAERQRTRLTTSEQQIETRLARLQTGTGFGTVTGPGVRVTIKQRPGADANQAVRDSDLALLVNGLWTAGAEAISVNGQRITAKTAIRSSGPAIEVNSVGIAPPYSVLAIGDTGSLQANFFDTPSGLAFDMLARDFGFDYVMDNEDDLRLPAAPSELRRLRWIEDEPATDEETQEGRENLP